MYDFIINLVLRSVERTLLVFSLGSDDNLYVETVCGCEFNIPLDTYEVLSEILVLICDLVFSV